MRRINCSHVVALPWQLPTKASVIMDPETVYVRYGVAASRPIPMTIAPLTMRRCKAHGNTRCWPRVGLMLGQRRRRWTNNKPTLDQNAQIPEHDLIEIRKRLPSAVTYFCGRKPGRVHGGESIFFTDASLLELIQIRDTLSDVAERPPAECLLQNETSGSLNPNVFFTVWTSCFFAVNEI